nr:polyprotein [Mute swan feces associated hepatovirus 1]
MRLGLLRGMLGFSPLLYVDEKMIKNIVEAVNRVVGLQDPQTEAQQMASDRVGVGGSHGMTSIDQALVTAVEHGSLQPEPLPANLDLPASLDTIGERFYLVYNNDWAHTQGYLNKLLQVDLYQALVNSEFASAGNLKTHRYMQAGVEVIVQVNSHQFQMGCLLCMLVPGFTDGISYSGFGMFPHCIINLNINNCGRIKAPWVYTRGAYNLSTPIEPVWTLVGIILTPIETGGNNATSATVSVLARFVDLKLHGMHPTSNMGPEEVRISSSFNVVNLANNSGARARVSLALADESYLGDDSVTGGMYVDNFRAWTKTPGFIGRFAFNSSANFSERIAAIPVSPLYYSVKDSEQHWHPPPATSICQMFSWWRGDVVFYFQVVTTRFHSGRLMFSFIPGNDVTSVVNLTMQKASSAMSCIMDIQGTSSTCCLRIPYTADTQYRSCVSTGIAQNPAYGSNWLSTSIGKVCCFVYSKLRFPTGAPSHIYINVYMCLENAELFCPMYSNIGGFNSITATGLVSCAGDDAEEEMRRTGAFQTPGVIQQDPTIGQEYINKPETKIPIGAVLSIEEPALEIGKPQTFAERAPGTPRHKRDHMDMYNYMGRGHIFFSYTLNAVQSGKKVLTVPLDIRRRGTAGKAMGGSLQWFYSLFHLFQGPIDLSFVFSGSAEVDVLIWFTPHGYLTSATWNQESGTAGLNADYVSGFPFVRCNTRQTNNIQLRVPWYTCLSAISACVRDECPDTSLGSISLYVSGYSTNEERLGITCYWSIPREAKFSVPRAPLRQNLIQPSSTSGLGYVMEVDELHRPMGAVETSVDFVPDSDPLPLPPRRVLKPYKDLRMAVGEERLKYAKEELHRSKSSDALWSQAGPMFDDYSIVQQRVGDILYRGICYKGDVYYVKCINPALRAAPLIKSAMLVHEPQTSAWLNLNSKVEAYHFDCFVGALEGDIKMNWKHFASGEFVQAMGQDLFLQLDTACEGNLTGILSVFISKSLGLLDQTLMNSEVFKDVTEVTGSIKEVAKECKEVIEVVRNSIGNMAKTLSPKRRSFALKILSVIARSGIKLYVCIRSEWKLDVALPLLLDLAIDFTQTTLDVGEIFRGVIRDIFGSGELEATSGEWIRNTVGCVSLLKTARDCIAWVVNKFNEWYDEKFGNTREKMQQILEAEEKIDALLSYVDNFCLEKHDQNAIEEARGVLIQLRSLMALINEIPDLRPHGSDIRSAINLMHTKLRGFPIDNSPTQLRDEPSVLYIHGPRGSGKSLLAMAVACKICKLKGVDPEKNIFTKAPVSDYWEGYANQLVCILDDIGQATSDEDWTNFCQIVSCCPVRLNMPNLEEKGIHFTTPFIICTSNLADPEPKTIYSKEALLRRLHVKVHVKPHRYYLTTQNGIPVLDVPKAMSHDVIKDLSCLVITEEGNGEVTYEQLVNKYTNIAGNKAQLMRDFMTLWAQSGPDSLASWFTVRCPNPKPGLCARLMRCIREHKVLVIGGIVITLASAIAIFAAVSRAKPKAEAAYSGHRPIKNVVRLGEEINSQSVIDLANVIEKNLMRFGISFDGESVSWRVNCLQLFDNWCVVPRHAVRFDVGVTHYFFLRNGTTYVVRRDRIVEVPSEECPDLLFLNVPGMPKGKDIVSHFIKESDVPACDGRLATLATLNQGLFQIISEGDVAYKNGITYNHSSPSGKEKIYIPRIWQGRGEAAPGTCGGVLISSNNRLGNPFLGVHLAAGGGTLVSCLLTQEEIVKLKSVIPKTTRITQCKPTTELVATGNRTQFQRSVLYDVLPVECERAPALLFNDNRADVDVLAMMFQKYNFPIVREPPKYVDSVMAVLDCLLDVHGMPKCRRLSEREAIEGIEGMDAIDMTTSPGIPYVFQNKRKSDMIRAGVVCDAELRSRIDMHLNDMIFGVPCDLTFMTCPKDELRSMEKVLSGNTRMIEASPLCFVIAFRRMFGYSMAWLQSHPGWQTGIAVGIDPDKDWDPIFKDALRFGERVLCLDYSSFDATVSPFMIEQAVYLMGYLCCADESVVYSVGRTLSYSRRQVQNMLYYVQGSLASGTPATSVLNSLMNLCILTYVFSEVLQVSAFEVRRVVKFLTYGDDVIVLWNRKYDHHALDLVKLHGMFASLGLIITGADKGVVSFEDLLGVRFLKRGARVGVLGIFQPTIEKATIYGLLLWKRKGAKLEDNIDQALAFAFHHGETFFQELRGTILVALQQLGLQLRVKSYREYEARFIALHFNVER